MHFSVHAAAFEVVFRSLFVIIKHCPLCIQTESLMHIQTRPRNRQIKSKQQVQMALFDVRNFVDTIKFGRVAYGNLLALAKYFMNLADIEC